MKRELTNTIRWVLDELLPRPIRNNRYFMWLVFALAYKKWSVSLEMNFKTQVLNMSDKDLIDFYSNLNTIGSNRKTDLNQKCIDSILVFFKDKSGSLLDVGCGKGYMLNLLKEHNPQLLTTGLDLNPPEGPAFIKGFTENLPFDQDSFDYVLSTHNLEHTRDLKKAVTELLRVAKRKIVIVVPKQRYFYYTLDEHLHFFYHKEEIEQLFAPQKCETTCLDGDWFMIVTA